MWNKPQRLGLIFLTWIHWRLNWNGTSLQWADSEDEIWLWWCSLWWSLLSSSATASPTGWPLNCSTASSSPPLSVWESVLTATRQLDDFEKSSHYCITALCAVRGRSLGGDSKSERSSAHFQDPLSRSWKETLCFLMGGGFSLEEK